jgi:phosphate starvation-inducible PhoH-like protein
MRKEGKEKGRVPDEQVQNLHRFHCLNDKQEEFRDAITSSEITICTGPAGTGKTYCALGTAFGLLGNKYKRIVIVKSVQTITGENIGYLPGSMEEKMEPYIVSFTGNIDKLFAKKGVSNDFIKKGLIDILPIAYVRGVTQDDCIVIVDETQNIDTHTFKSLITRIGSNCKFIFLGDTEQVDRKKIEESCLLKVAKIFQDSSVVSVVEFEDSDSVRNPIIKDILAVLREHQI